MLPTNFGSKGTCGDGSIWDAGDTENRTVRFILDAFSMEGTHGATFKEKTKGRIFFLDGKAPCTLGMSMTRTDSGPRARITAVVSCSEPVTAEETVHALERAVPDLLDDVDPTLARAVSSLSLPDEGFDALFPIKEQIEASPPEGEEPAEIEYFEIYRDPNDRTIVGWILRGICINGADPVVRAAAADLAGNIVFDREASGG
jgi:hypothetical protein